MAVVGTRPEALKMAPVIAALRRRKRFRVLICATGQHRRLLDEALKAFALKPDIDLNLMRRDQTPSEVLARVIAGMDRILARTAIRLALVQGDTTSALGAALAAYHRKIAIAHIEAGLRTFDKDHPFPEEENRVLIDHLSDLLFAPTPAARKNLLREGIRKKSIFLTGNTVVDALSQILSRPGNFKARELRRFSAGRRLAVLTLHRRESFGKPLETILRGVARAARHLPDTQWIFPIHPTPRVRHAARKLLRSGSIALTPPLSYPDFVRLMLCSDFIVTDSGGIQEEAPSLGKPVIVARDATERSEGLGTWSVLAGRSEQAIERTIMEVASGRRKLPLRGANPFGDGHASERIARILERWIPLHGGRRSKDALTPE